MGFVCCSRGLQTRICKETSFLRSKRNKDCISKCRDFSKRNHRAVTKRCNRKSSKSTEKFRFLQYTFSSAKKIGQIKACDKPETSEQLSPQKAFQDGHFVKSIECSDTRRLGSVNRPDRRISACSNFSKTSPISQILYSRSLLPVESTVFRADLGTSSLHKSTISSNGTFALPKHSNTCISGRPTHSKSVQRKIKTRPRNMHQSSGITRIHNQCRKVGFNTKPNNCVPRNTISVERRFSKTNRRKSHKTLSRGKSHNKRSKSSKRLPSSFRRYSVMHRNHSQCKTLHATNSTPSTVVLETLVVRSSKNNPSYSASDRPSSVVVKPKQCVKGQIHKSKRTICDGHNRCIQDGIRGSHEFSNSTRGMVTRTKRMAHKSSRNGSSVSSVETFHSQSERSNYPNQVRQFNRGSIYKQTRRNTVSPVMFQNMGNMELGNSKPNLHKSSSRCRQGQHFGRQTEQVQGNTHRMDLEQGHCTSDFSEVGLPTGRSVCVPSEQTNTSLLFMDSRSECPGNRCSDNFLGRHVCLGVPSNMPDTQSNSTHAQVSLSDHSDSSPVAQETLVYRNPESTDSLSNQTTSNSGSASATQISDKTSESRNIQFDSLVTFNKQFEKRGFSQETKKLLCASWRTGTQKDYVSKFKKFSSWCDSREIDPYNATLTQIADFLTHLYTSGLQYRTIAGYRSMLSSILDSVENRPVGQHPYIVRLLKGIFNSRPPKSKLLPEWELPKVLKMLEKGPFEPMGKASLKHITLKTVFLVAITTFRRCSDLQSLRIGEEAVSVQKKGVTFIRQGLSKQDRPSHYGSKIFVPAFTSNKHLDPKRALYFYLKITDSFRQDDSGRDETKLFLSIKKPHKPVSSQTISRWIVKTVKMAYKFDIAGVKGHSTRAVGPSWALYNGASIKSILEAADWSRETTFILFYLRDVDTHVLDK